MAAPPQLGYDSAGFLTSYTDPNGHQTQLGYDHAGRLASQKDPLNRVSTFGYDVNDNLTSFTNRRNQTATFTYDVLNRIVSETYADATVQRSYDDAAGRLVQLVDSQSGTFNMTYDAVGWLVKMVGPNGTISYTRDALERVASRQVLGRPAVNYTYDANGNLSSASLGTATVTRNYDGRDLPDILHQVERGDWNIWIRFRRSADRHVRTIPWIGHLLALPFVRSRRKPHRKRHGRGAGADNSQRCGKSGCGNEVTAYGGQAIPTTPMAIVLRRPARRERPRTPGMPEGDCRRWLLRAARRPRSYMTGRAT